MNAGRETTGSVGHFYWVDPSDAVATASVHFLSEGVSRLLGSEGEEVEGVGGARPFVELDSP